MMSRILNTEKWASFVNNHARELESSLVNVGKELRGRWCVEYLWRSSFFLWHGASFLTVYIQLYWNTNIAGSIWPAHEPHSVRYGLIEHNTDQFIGIYYENSIFRVVFVFYSMPVAGDSNSVTENSQLVVQIKFALKYKPLAMPDVWLSKSFTSCMELQEGAAKGFFIYLMVGARHELHSNTDFISCI